MPDSSLTSDKQNCQENGKNKKLSENTLRQGKRWKKKKTGHGEIQTDRPDLAVS